MFDDSFLSRANRVEANGKKVVKDLRRLNKMLFDGKQLDSESIAILNKTILIVDISLELITIELKKAFERTNQ